MALAVVQPELEGSAERAADEVERSVAIDVGERRPRGGQPTRVDAAGCGDVGKVKVAVVVIERGRSLDGRQEDVRTAVPVDVTESGTRANEEVAVGHRVRVVHIIAMHKAGGGCGKLREAGVAARGHDEIAPAIPSLLVPGRVHGRCGCAGNGKDDKRDGAGAR